VIEIHITVDGCRYRVNADAVTDVSLPLDFHGGQPRHFGAPPASARPLRSNGFVGDTRAGGSCNCEVLTLIPHCNGTHTESVGHVISGATSVAALATEGLIPALLLSVPTRHAESCAESADPLPLPGDRLVTAAALREAAERAGNSPQAGLVIRTLPNDEGKRSRDYGAGDLPPYLSTEAADLIVSWGVRHLLVDLPSLDRTHDQGRLTGHRRFWGLSQTGVSTTVAERADATITEMIFVPDAVADGLYALNLQIAPFVTDAAPSRPLLFALEAT
jgi:arylformamidase